MLPGSELQRAALPHDLQRTEDVKLHRLLASGSARNLTPTPPGVTTSEGVHQILTGLHRVSTSGPDPPSDRTTSSEDGRWSDELEDWTHQAGRREPRDRDRVDDAGWGTREVGGRGAPREGHSSRRAGRHRSFRRTTHRLGARWPPGSHVRGGPAADGRRGTRRWNRPAGRSGRYGDPRRCSPDGPVGLSRRRGRDRGSRRSSRSGSAARHRQREARTWLVRLARPRDVERLLDSERCQPPRGCRRAKSSAISSNVAQRTPSCPLMWSMIRSCIASTAGRPLTSGWMVIVKTA